MKKNSSIFDAMPARCMAAAAVLISCTGYVAAQDGGESTEQLPWRVLLSQQLRAEKSCDLSELLLFDEFKRGDALVIEGKILCLDGRQFDFTRPREHQKFEIKICEPAIC